MLFDKKSLKEFVLPILISLLFFAAYAILAIVRHNHFQSFGFDLGLNDQVIWEYSHFKPPITTIDHVPFISNLNVHVEIIYALISPFYWIWNNIRMFLILQAGFVSFSAIAIYLLAKQYNLHRWIQIALMFSYLLFYGVQNALWFDAHSAAFATGFIAWFIYFLVKNKTRTAFLFFILAVTSKENIAGITFLISLVYFLFTKRKTALFFVGLSLFYLFLVFGIYFGHFVNEGYRFAGSKGFFSNLDPTFLFNTKEKLQVYFYSLISFGFIPILFPWYLIPAFGNLASYFILGSNVSTAQGLFLHYRIELVPLMSWATIVAVSKFKFLNTKWIALYLVLCALFVQYSLHLPLSYLSKQWFWQESPSYKSINNIINDYLPPSVSVVSQNNIIPHISHRYEIYTLYPEQKSFDNNSPCKQNLCDWFRWSGNPKFLIVDTSSQWDIRHLLANKENYILGIGNLEKQKYIEKYKQQGTTILYKVLKNPG